MRAKPVISAAGSANITRRGLLINRELCKIVENDHNDIDTYVNEELGIEL